MRKYANCVIQADQHAMWQAPDGSREVAPLITEETCGAQSCSAGLWWLRPGQCSPGQLSTIEAYECFAWAGHLVRFGQVPRRCNEHEGKSGSAIRHGLPQQRKSAFDSLGFTFPSQEGNQ